MEFNFNGQTTVINSQIGNNNTYNNNSLAENDWENLREIFSQLLQEMRNNDSDSYLFFDESIKYTFNKDKKGLKNHFKKNCTEFIKNVIYNMASTGIITLLSKIGIFL